MYKVQESKRSIIMPLQSWRECPGLCRHEHWGNITEIYGPPDHVALWQKHLLAVIAKLIDRFSDINQGQMDAVLFIAGK